MKPLSRQRLHQLARIAQGLCSRCKEPITHYAELCDDCGILFRERARNRKGCEPYSQTKRMGRPPFVDKLEQSD